DDGHIRINYILLRDAVDADIEVKLAGIRDRSVSGEIFAYYKEFDSRDVLVESLYKASLFESFGGSGFKDGALLLTRSRLAVPTKGSLVIETRLMDFKSGAYILRDFCVFDSDCNEGSEDPLRAKHQRTTKGLADGKASSSNLRDIQVKYIVKEVEDYLKTYSPEMDIRWYMKETPNLGLWYPKGSGFDLKAYSDSDYAGCNLDRKSTSGGCQILGMLECKEAKSSVAMSSAEAEYGNYVVAIGCCAQVLWIKSQLADYDVLYDKVPIFCDNTSAIAISNNPVLHSRTKHIDIRYHFIRDHILKGDIELHFIPTDLQLADIFTKPLAEPMSWVCSISYQRSLIRIRL
ncbi:hypothetical protein Tco_1257006, partial [Tanacetum coccineum]